MLQKSVTTKYETLRHNQQILLTKYVRGMYLRMQFAQINQSVCRV